MLAEVQDLWIYSSDENFLEDLSSFDLLKEQFTQKCESSQYLLTSLDDGTSRVKVCRPQNISGASTKNSVQHSGSVGKTTSVETLRSQIDSQRC